MRHDIGNGVNEGRQKIGAVAQLVEQRTENPCVAGSIPAHTTRQISLSSDVPERFFLLVQHRYNELLI